MLQNLQNKWASLSERGKLALGLAVVLAVLLLASAASYLAPSCGRRADVRQQATAKVQHQQAQARGQAAQTLYQLDSTRLATQAEVLRQQDSILAQQDKQLSQQRGARVGLPASNQLPVEK